MSTTITTTTVTYARPRRLSLSLISPRTPPPLLDLPAELVLDILELSLQHSKPRDLAVICKGITSLLNVLLYSTVVLDSKETINLFHRTTLAKPIEVNKVILTCDVPEDSVQFRRILDIMASCSGLRSLVVEGQGGIPSMIDALRNDNLSEILVHSFNALRHNPIPIASPSSTRSPLRVTHLRFCEPGDGFIAPCSLLEDMGKLPCLSHLQLSRRVNSNADNDELFVGDVAKILRKKPLKMLVVSLFPQTWTSPPSEDVAESSLWATLEELAREDRRLFVRKGTYREWNVKRDGTRKVDFGEVIDRFWISAKSDKSE